MTAYYEIRVAGTLPIEVLADFELLRAAPAPVETVLHGPLPDQAALAAFLTRLEDFGANVIEIRRLRENLRLLLRLEAEHLRLGGAELLVGEDALVVQPLDVAELFREGWGRGSGGSAWLLIRGRFRCRCRGRRRLLLLQLADARVLVRVGLFLFCLPLRFLLARHVGTAAYYRGAQERSSSPDHVSLLDS
jgi:hypothetical protein